MKTFLDPLEAKEERVLLEQMEAGSVEAKHKLIEHNMRLVAHVAKKYYSPNEDMEDLLSIGTIGLVKAVDTYNAGKGYKLATYAARCIDNAILSQMRLWWRTSCPRAEKNQNGVFWRRFPRIFTSFAPLRTAM